MLVHASSLGGRLLEILFLLVVLINEEPRVIKLHRNRDGTVTMSQPHQGKCQGRACTEPTAQETGRRHQARQISQAAPRHTSASMSAKPARAPSMGNC